MMRDRAVWALGLVLLALVVSGRWLPQWALFLVTVALGKGFVVLGLMILLRAGLVSFGQGLYYCLGAYAAGMLSQYYGVRETVTLLASGAAVAAAVAVLLGFLLANYRGIFFGLLSLAFSMILYGIIVKSAALGSTDGFTLPPPIFWEWGWRPRVASRYSPSARRSRSVACFGYAATLTRRSDAWRQRSATTSSEWSISGSQCATRFT